MAYKVKGTCVDAAFLVLGPYQTNVYIVSDGSATFVVDPASDAKKIAAALGGRKLDAIVLTHRHSDHVAAAAELRSLTGATVIASAIDADMICGDKPVPRDDQKFPACPVDQRVNHGDVVKIGNMPWKVISTPGHTEGSMCLFLDSSLTERLDAKPVLIAGDTLFFGSIGRTDFSGGSMSAMRKSLKRLAVLPDDTVVLPGHGNLTTIGGERRRVFAFDAEGAAWSATLQPQGPASRRVAVGAGPSFVRARSFADVVGMWLPDGCPGCPAFRFAIA